MRAGLAPIIMEADLAVRLTTRIGCVENSVSGTSTGRFGAAIALSRQQQLTGSFNHIVSKPPEHGLRLLPVGCDEIIEHAWLRGRRRYPRAMSAACLKLAVVK